MNTWRTLLKLENTKNWTTKYQRINTRPMKIKTIKYTHRLIYITSTWIILLKIKIQKTEHDGAQKRHGHCWKSEQHFYDGAQNRISLHIGWAAFLLRGVKQNTTTVRWTKQ